MKISKVLTIFPILYLCLAVQPAMAQREAWEDLVKKTSALGSEISAVIKDTAELHRKIESIAPQMLDWDAEIDSINKQIKSISNSIDSDNFALLKNEIDSVAEVKKALAARMQELIKLKSQRLSDLANLKNKLSDMSVYSQIKDELVYVRNQETLKRKYSLISEIELGEIEVTTENFSQMEGFGEYQLRVKKVVANKRLYEQAINALNSPFNNDVIENIRGDLMVLFRIEKDDWQKEEFKLSEEQYSEMDTLDIKLSRYQNGIKELKKIVSKINKNEEIATCRKRHDKESCLGIMRGIVSPQDGEGVNVRCRYFDMIPHLNDLLREYWSELQENPFDVPTQTELKIKQLIDE